MYNYKKAMYDDIIEHIKDHFTGEEIREKLSDLDEWAQELNDDLWIVDSVTGNASGSYTCNSYIAREYVLDNFDLLKEAAQEFCCMDTIGEEIMNEAWEYCDVTIRCYLLSEMIYEVLEELKNENA